jgi:ribonuclease-3
LFPSFPEGELTARRSYLVQTTTLASKAKLLGLDQELLLSKGEAEAGGRSNPGLLANTFEAVLGALYLDSGLDACRQFLEEVFPEAEITADLDTKDPKSRLQELAQGQNLGTPQYHTVAASGPDHAKSFTVSVSVNGQSVATGLGASKQKAETEAAKSALTKLFPPN